MKEENIDPVLLTTSQAAAMVGVKPRTWYVWDRLGFIPQPVKINTRLFWRRDELLAWINEDCPKREDWIFWERK